MKSRFFYISFNFIVPGMGQLAAKRYFRGVIQGLSAIGAIFWLAAVVAMPFVNFYSSDMSGELPKVQYNAMLLPILFFLAVFIWSIIDLMFGLNITNHEKTEEN